MGRKIKTEPSEQDKQIIGLATANPDVKELSCIDIAKKFNISRQRVQQILKRWGIDYKRDRPTKSINEAVKLYEQGKTLAEITELTGYKGGLRSIHKYTDVRHGLGYKIKLTEPSEKEKKAFNMQNNGKSIKEIAEALNTTPGSVGTIMVRARKRWGKELLEKL